MKKTILIGAAAALMLGMASCNGKGKAPESFGDSLAMVLGEVQGLGFNQQIQQAPESQPKIDKQEFLAGLKTVLNVDTANLSYLQGLSSGMQMVQMIMQMEEAGINFDREKFYNEFARGLKADTVSQDRLELLNNEAMVLFGKAQEIMMQKRQEKMVAQQEADNKKYEANKKEGEDWLNKQISADNSIKRNDSGLAIKIEKMGTGAVAGETDIVPVKYTGKLIDGTEFDSSKDEFAKLPAGGVVPGFKEALTTLPAGTKATLYIPENLGYGRRGTPDGKIAPGSTLVFNVEIGAVEK